MKKIFNTIILMMSIAALLLTACGSAPQSGRNASSVLASTTFLADIAQHVAGDRLKVESLLPVGTDPHSYQPTPQDVAKIADSPLLIVNGLEYEHFIEALLENSGGEKIVITASDGLEPRHMEEHADEAGSGEGDEHEAGDPHMWLDPNNVITYVQNIREGLTHFDPDGAAVYQSNADAYIAELQALDAWIVEQVSQIPQEKRLLVTNHEAMGYFAERYGFTIAGTVIESFSSDASPSAGQMAGLIDQIKTSGARAIFLDASDNESLAKQIAEETGVRVVTNLHLESLTEGAPAATYMDMMKDNVTLIVDALQ
ncbi:MAG: zinc ABC transporter substrate-binding protein [Anaerolineales bacterium]|nr:zinc ABC transporter substrate-binding protein [Anaerolineales bacterium]